MRIVVMSDSHGHYRGVHRIIEANKNDTDVFIHLGDGADEFEELHQLYPHLYFIQVRGNNDWGCDAPVEQLITLGGKKILATHGHAYRVKYSLEDYEIAAQAQEAKIALYGHTHCASIEYDDGLYIINPGSVYDSSWTPASYLRIDIEKDKVIPIIVKI